MIIATESLQDILIITLPGETLDAGNAKILKEELAPMMQPGAKLIFDLTQLRFVDSSGLGLLLSCLRQVHNTGGDLKLCGLNKAVRALFELVRMHRVFEIFATREEAKRSYGV